MASFLSKLFGFSNNAPAEPDASSGETETYGDCLIRVTPMKEGAQFRLAGSIEKDVDGMLRVRTFIRADLFSSRQDVVDATLRKAHQIIDQHGASLFSDDAATRQV
ncbi:HlyU family transcriptional regulator [Pararhizobium gei]|uniref:HlyU family transcriptional regulator n=1 Tax=Pararhizobium gei TaxID=1395951 RepID=UPI0023DA7CDA|nr:HlyU family transcriptional regulator [Rhizobium gei]